MRFKGQIISFILLLAFGWNVAGDLFALHEKVVPETEHSSVVQIQQGQSSIGSATPSFSQNDTSLPSDSCDDPCHLGSCHLGHCSHLVKTELNMASPTLTALSHGLWNLLVPSNPFLEGPKHPPRYLHS